MRCNNCGKKLSDDAAVCPVCGSAVQNQTQNAQDRDTDHIPLKNSPQYIPDQPNPQTGQHFCPVCGSALSPNMKFCAVCGNKQKEARGTASKISALSKYKKYIAIAAVLVVVVIIVVALISKNNVENSIVGTWETIGGYNDSGYVELDEDERTEGEFKSNDKLRIDDQIGTYTIDDDILTISSKDYDDEDSFMIVKVTRKKLVLEKIGGSATRIVFERQ